MITYFYIWLNKFNIPKFLESYLKKIEMSNTSDFEGDYDRKPKNKKKKNVKPKGDSFLKDIENKNSTNNDRENDLLINEKELDDICADVEKMPECAEKIILNLIACFIDSLNDGKRVIHLDVKAEMENLLNRLNKEELF